MKSDPSVGGEEMYLLEWAWRIREEKRELEMVDPKILHSLDRDEVLRAFGIAFFSTQTSPARRPSTSRVVAMLLGDLEIPQITVKPSYLMNLQSDFLTASNSSAAPTMFTEDQVKTGG